MPLQLVVPTLNEAEALPSLLQDLRAQGVSMATVTVVDGGSTDDTRALASAAGCTVLDSLPGRARQLQTGVAAAPDAAAVWMVHADTRLLPGAVSQALAVADGGGAVWARFGVKLDDNHPLLRLVAWMMNHRSCLTGIATGDQGLVLTAGALAAVGGVPQQALMEDVELSVRLKRLVGRPQCLPALLVTSARRWRQHGMLRTIGTMWLLRLRYHFGASPQALHQAYYGRSAE